MNNYIEISIGEACSRFSSGKSIMASKIGEKGNYPVFGGNGLRGYTDTYNFDGECAIIGRQGAYCGNVRYFKGKAYMTEHAIVACAKDEYNIGYMSFLFSLMHLEQYQGQSAQPGLSVSTLSKVKITLPSKPEQDKVFSCLKELEEKIENNNIINAELETIVKTIYDYWFLQFDFPDENGKPYKSSGGKMIWNERLKRNIPENWEAALLSDIAEMKFKSIKPNKNEKYEHYSIPAYDESGLPIIESGSEIDSNKYIVPINSILVSKLNPQFKRIWNVGEICDTSICSTEFMPFLSLNNKKEFLYSVLNSDSFYKFMVQSSSSSTGSRKRIQPEICMSFEFALPKNSELIDSYVEKVKPCLELIIKNKIENQELVSLRDFLLPLLMNGQVGFKN